MSQRIDAEVRLLRPEWCDVAFRPENEPKVSEMIYSHPFARKALPKASLDGLVAEMDRTGIERCVVRGLFWQDLEMCQAQNEYLAQVRDECPDRFLAMAVVPSPLLTDVRESVRRLHADLGFNMIEMIPSWHGYKIDDAVAAPALEEADLRGLVVGLEVDHMIRDPRCVDTAFSALTVAQRHPDLKFLVAHLGGLLCLYGHNPDVKSRLANMLFVTSVPKTPQWIGYALDAVGTSAIAFGTDFPFNIHSSQAVILETIERFHLGPAEKAAILGENLMRFLDLEEMRDG